MKHTTCSKKTSSIGINAINNIADSEKIIRLCKRIDKNTISAYSTNITIKINSVLILNRPVLFHYKVDDYYL